MFPAGDLSLTPAQTGGSSTDVTDVDRHSRGSSFSGESGQASTDGSDFRRCFYGFHSAARAEKAGARHPKLPKSRIARGARALPEGAEIVNRAAARLCERPRSIPTRATAPAGPENQGAPTAGRSYAPAGAGRCFWRDRWRRSHGSLADRLAIGGPAGPQDQCPKCPVSLPRCAHPLKVARSLLNLRIHF